MFNVPPRRTGPRPAALAGDVTPTVHTLGLGPAASSEVPPTVIKVVGTHGVCVAQLFVSNLKRRFGTIPESLIVSAVDSTEQPRIAGVDPLPPECFFNLAGVPHLTDRLRRAHEDEEVAQWMHRKVTLLPTGRGTCGQPALARFLYEAREHELLPAWTKQLIPLTPRMRPGTASRADGHPMFRSQGLTVTPTGAINVVYFVGGYGGTSGATLDHDRVLFQSLLGELGIDANLFLFLALPPVTSAGDPGSARKRELMYARLQELVDMEEGRVTRWPLRGRVLTSEGSVFTTIAVMPEPQADRVAESQRQAAEFLAALTGPLGKTFFDRAVDQVDHCRTRGCGGQKQFLTLIGMARVHASAYGDPVAFAEPALGRLAVAPVAFDAAAEAEKVLASQRLTVGELMSTPVPITAVPFPVGVDGPVALSFLESTYRAEAADQAAERNAAFDRRFSAVLGPAREAVRSTCLTHGPGAASQLAESLTAAARDREAKLAAACAKLPTEPAAAATATVAEQAATRRKAARVRATTEVLEHATSGYHRLAVAFERVAASARVVAKAFDDMGIAFNDRYEAFDSRESAEHAVLDRDGLETIVGRVAIACTREARERAAEALDGETPAARLKVDVETVVSRHARGFERLRDFDEALRVAGPRGLRVLDNAAAAAEPSVRIDPMCDVHASAIRHAYLEAPDTHRLAEASRRQGRTVLPAPRSEPDVLTLITADYGVEPAALVPTREAVEAHATSRSEIPPFPDHRYRPLADVVVPASHEWMTHIAIAVHEVLKTGVIRHETRGYMYGGNDLLGADRAEAAAALRATVHRRAFLPPPDELARGVAAALKHAAGDDDRRHIEILDEIEARLERHIADADPRERFALTIERSAVRAYRVNYEEKMHRKAAHDNSWNTFLPDRGRVGDNGHGNGSVAGRGDGPAPPRKSPQEGRT